MGSELNCAPPWTAEAFMKILVDATFLFPTRVGGAEQMLYGLLDALEMIEEKSVCTVVCNEEGAELLRALRPTSTIRSVATTGNRFLDAEHVAAKWNYDVLLSVNYYTPIASLMRRKKVVTVVHDLQFRVIH